jgi:hypothetical protein
LPETGLVWHGNIIVGVGGSKEYANKPLEPAQNSFTMLNAPKEITAKGNIHASHS